MTPSRLSAEREEASFAALETNHYAVKNLNKTFYMKRGEGPFGSLGNKEIIREKQDDRSGSFLQSQGSTDILDLELGLAETSVPIMQMKDSQYCGMLGIGTPPQWVRPIFDTGSTNLWVVGSKCTDDTCKKVTQFDPTKSGTFEYTSPPVHLDITFGTGRIEGTTGVDNFQIGPFTVKRQTFGLVEGEGGHNMHGNIFKSIDFEGIVGMGFPEMSSTGATPIYDNIMNQAQLKRSEFAFYVAKGSPVSALFFGGVDPRFYEPPIHMFPVEREHYWEVALDAIYVGDKKFCCEGGTKNYVILDSGTSFNTLPGAEMKSFLEMIPSQDCGGEDDRFLQQYPDITYVIGGVSFVLKPEDYLVRSKMNICKPAYMQIDVPSEFGHAYILGSVAFMRHFFTVYRRSDGKTPSLVGIARAVHSPENKQYLQQVVDAYPAGTFKEGDLLALQRSTGGFGNLLLEEEVALRNSSKTAI
ncbi:eukaryotic aspartyl [Cyclospora cayetanensis]|uniref:Eukaryotic aspartyl n=1 Tax=Cyclospora cayetanensis TaxID=88456 RepID=A0A1D3D558_9EIME|nr:eukaryotic aspartyl [Cyclospora cayetanensis]